VSVKKRTGSVNFRESLYALSDVIINRPHPLREFDQIYMKLPDMLLQAELIGRWFAGRHVVFIGDGDAIGLTLIHLANQELLPDSPAHIRVLDFDQRVVNSVNQFAEQYGLRERIDAELYNVVDPIPEKHWQKYDAFYTNPPWGASNDGSSVCQFLERGVEACRGMSLGSVVIGDHQKYPWTHTVQATTNRFMLDRHFRVAEMLPEFHQYHLDDNPELTSCCLMFQRFAYADQPYASERMSDERLSRFYGSEDPLKVQYVKDLTGGGKLASRDVEMIPLGGSIT
jgi:predicted methyltransferase